MEIGNIVVTKNSGVCVIVDKQEMIFGGNKREYFILKPYFESEKNNTKIFVPCDNLSLIRPVMEKEKVLEIISKMPSMEKIWDNDQKVRKAKYEEIYKSGDIYGICQIVKSLYLQNEQLKLAKHTLSMLDREYLNNLKKGIYQEFAIVLEVPYEEVETFISKQIG